MTGVSEQPGPLAGLKVIEMGQLIAGPFCGQLLADMGAEVVKIEPPGTGDPMRNWGQGEKPSWWQVIGRGKFSVALDLRSAEGQGVARSLIAEADILVENFRPGTLEKWHLSPASLLADNPGLIVVRVSGYGQTGPYASRAGYGGAGEAMAGLRGLVGYPDRPPVRVGLSIGDTLAASYAAMGALAALRHRDLSGQGQVVDAALYESVLQVMESTVADYSATGHQRQRTGSILPKIAPSNVYPARDGEIMIGGNGDSVFARLCAAMDRPDLLEDPRYATHLARGEHQEDLDELIAEWTARLTLKKLEALMQAHAIPSSRLYTAADMLADPHFAAREAIVTVGDLQMQGTFPKFSATPSRVRKPAPVVPGEDTDDVLQRWLGDRS